jgi:hypothetical protein
MLMVAYTLSAWEGLSIIVDGVVVKSAIIAGFKQGILAYWPPSVDLEVLDMFNKLYVKTRTPSYMVLHIEGFHNRFLAIVNGDKVFAMEIDPRVDALKMGEKMLRVFETLNRLARDDYKKPVQQDIEDYYEDGRD